MKYLWLFWLPLLYLPDLSFANKTDFGTLSISDYFIGPYLIFLFLRGHSKWNERFETSPKLYIHYLLPTFSLFIWWAFISTITIYFRYNYSDLYHVNFGLFKIAKLSLYGITAIYTMQTLSKASKQEYHGFLWAMLVCGLIVGGGLLLTGNSIEVTSSSSVAKAEEVFADNAVSVMLSMIIVFFIGMLVRGNGTTLWQRLTMFSLIIIVLGFVSARGRGGWVAAIIAMVYIASRINIKQTIRASFIIITLITFAYNQNPTFRIEVDKTLYPDPEYLAKYDVGVAGIDDGGRFGILQVEFSLIFDEPLFGRGLFHRGSLSGTYSSGSHNFFVQMFLELGIPGGIFVLIIIRQMWLHASTENAKKNKFDLPVKASIIAAIISGNSGEYFYGGMVLFTLFLTYAIVGSLNVQQSHINESSDLAL